MKDGNENKRYLLVDATHPAYNGLVESFRALHTAKEAGNTLPIRPNTAGTEAIVKVVAHVGWVEEEAGRINAGLVSGVILAVYTYDELPEVTALLGSAAWPQEEE